MASDCTPSLTGIPLHHSTATKSTQHGDCGAGGHKNPHWHTGQTACSRWWGLLPALEARWRERESRSGQMGVQPQQQRDASPGPAITAASSRPLFSESPSSRAAQPPHGEERMGGLSGGKGLQKTTQISGVTHSFPRAGGPTLLAPTTPYLGRGKRASSASLLLRGPGITPMKHTHACHLLWGQQEC